MSPAFSASLGAIYSDMIGIRRGPTVSEKGEENSITQSQASASRSGSRKDRVLAILKGIIHQLSGLDPAELDIKRHISGIGIE